MDFETIMEKGEVIVTNLEEIAKKTGKAIRTIHDDYMKGTELYTQQKGEPTNTHDALNQITYALAYTSLIHESGMTHEEIQEHEQHLHRRG